MNPPPVHITMDQFPIIDNELHVGGLGVRQLAERAGQTPYFAYDRSVIAERIQQLRDALPGDIQLHYAIKANPMPELVHYMANLVDGFDVASAGELRLAQTTSMSQDNISFAGPGKTDAELHAAIEAGIVINMESEGEMRRIAAIAAARGVTPKVAIRINPDFELKSSGMKMGGGPKQFGVDAERVPDMLQEFASLPLEFLGFHIFSGSQNLKEDAIIKAHEMTFELALRMNEHVPSPIKLLNIGGGLGIPYFPGDKRLDLMPIGDNLARLLPGVKKVLDKAEIVLELGRYLVGEAGIYVCKVIDKKISRGVTFLITDGGMHHHLAASGNLGQVIRKNYPVTIGNRVSSTETEKVTVVGPLCTPLDLLADKMPLAKADIGDLVVIFQSGAYGYSASPKGFLSRPSAVELLV